MAGLSDLKKLISEIEGGKYKNKKEMGELERRALLGIIAVILVLAAVFLLFLRTVTSSSGAASCKSIVLVTQKYNCYNLLASQTGNYSLCSFLPAAQSSACIANVAEQRNNVTICGTINTSSSYYSNCVLNVSYALGRIDYCTQLRGENESDCAYALAKKDGFSRLSDCNAVNDPMKNQLCNYIYDYAVAQSSGRPSYCADLPNVTNNTMLNAIVSKNYTNQSALSFNYLQYLTANVTPRSFCYYRLASLFSNQSYCRDVAGTLSQVCYDSFSSAQPASNSSTSFPNYTQQIANVSYACAGAPAYAQSLCRFGMYTEFALSQKNATYCFNIQNTTYKYSCIAELAAKYNDSSYCNYIQQNLTAQQACRYSVGVVPSG